MTKAEMYEELKGDGVELRSINSMKADELSALYRDRFGVDPGVPRNSVEENTGSGVDQNKGDSVKETKADVETETKAETERIPALVFLESGWCEQLKRSYFRGTYRPASREEYLALRKFARKEI